MTNQQLIDFIKQQLQIGITREKINSELLANGWNAQDIAEGFIAAGMQTVPVPPSNPVSTLNSNLATNNPPVITDPTTIKEKTHSGGKIFLFIIILFLVAGFASAYYFKEEIVKLPIVKELFPSLSNKYSKKILSINQPSGPQTLDVNEMGTWTTMSSNMDNAYLSYSVNWGENKEICPSALAFCASAQSLPEKEISFSHAYAEPGIYVQTYTVTNNNGQSVSTNFSVNVGGVVLNDKPVSINQDTSLPVVDCGVSSAITFSSNKTIKADNATEKAWECITSNLQSCTKAKLDIGGLYKFEILGKNPNGCEISGPKIDLKTFKSSNVVCNLTQKMLDYSFKQADISYPGKNFYKGYSTAQITNIGGQEIKFSDGTKEIISCNPVDVVKKK